MSRYGIDYYGLGYYGPDVTSTFTAAPATAISVDYASILLTWTSPTGNWSKLKLVRNSYGFPTSPYDGIVLVNAFNGSNPTEFVDTFDLKEGAFYYYSIFVYEVNSYTWVRSADLIGLSVKNFGNGPKMFSYLPEVYKLSSAYSVTGNTDNQDLKDFLNLFGFQLDYAQTSTELLIDRYDVQKVNGVLIPLLLNEFGLEYEREVGLQQSRILVRDAVQLYKEKGTLQGLKEYIKAFSGYALTSAVAGVPNPATAGVVIGHNLMLDYNDSSFEEGYGHWKASDAFASLHSLTEKTITAVSLTSNVATITIGAHNYPVGTKLTISNCPIPLFNQTTPVTITAVTSTAISFSLTHANVPLTKTSGILSPYPLPWAELTAPLNFPNKQSGILSVHNGNGSAQTLTFNCGLENPISQGVPVTSGLIYTFSIRTSAKSTTRNVTAKIKWYDRFGALLSTSSGTATANTAGVLSVRPKVTATAPTDAYYAVPEVSIASVANLASSEFHYFDAAQFEQDSSATDFDEARNIHITLKANRVNELVNPDFVSPYTPWVVTGATYTTNLLLAEPNVDTFAVEQAELTSNVVTLHTTIIHHLEIGEQIGVVGVGSPYNGSWTVTSKTASTLSYALTHVDIPIATVSGSVFHASNALALTATATTATVQSFSTSADYMDIHYPGSSYTFSFAGQAATGTETLKGIIKWYTSSNTLISTETGINKTVGTSWTVVSVSGLAPTNAAYASVAVEWTTSIGNVVNIDQGVFENSPFVLPHFCGEGEVSVQESDVFWEGGVANASRSHYYKNRVAVIGRLTDTLKEFVPAGTTFTLYLAQPNT